VTASRLRERRASRREISLSLSPWTVGAVKLEVTGGSDKVDICEDQTGGDPLTGNDLEWDDRDPPEGQDNWAEKPSELWLEATAASGGPQGDSASLNYEGRTTVNTGGHMDSVKITACEVDLAATDLYGTVAEGDEEDPGALVHYNVDNDNSSDNSQGAPKHPGGDYLEDGPVTGENDPLPMTMSLAPDLREGIVTLSRGGSGVRVWKSAQKGAGNEILVDQDGKIWDLADDQQRTDFTGLSNSLYVEGSDGAVGALALIYFPPGGAEAIDDLVIYHFTAADCGDQPRTDNGKRQQFEAAFPSLVRCEWSITAPPSGVYNCIAWSVGETDVWYNKLYHNPPGDVGIDKEYGDDDGVFELSDMDAFYLDKKGWTPSAQGPTDAQAIYYSGFHAARKRTCACGGGRWLMFESKCGEADRIEHVWEQLNGGAYGDPVRLYK
jgi:hypothetical protein